MKRELPPKLKEQLEILPDKPGVYMMQDAHGNIIYVGKATSLKQRVRSYFLPGTKHGPKNASLVEKVEQIETVIVNNPAEALILECNLIKQYRPRYNVRLKDDKHYPYLKVTVEEEYPRLIMVRQVKKDGGRYFGPYTNSGKMHQTVKLLKQIYPLRTCPEKKFVKNKRECLNYHLGLCCGPCIGQIDKASYQKLVDGVIAFLQGRSKELLRDLNAKMMDAANERCFEEAAQLRDQILAVKEVIKQQQLDRGTVDDRDVIALVAGGNTAVIQLFFVRAGKVVGQRHYLLDHLENASTAEMLYEFLSQYYSHSDSLPPELLTNLLPTEEELLLDMLSSRRQGKVNLAVPQRGDKKRLLDLAQKNAQLLLEQKLGKEKTLEKGKVAMEELRHHLQLAKNPYRIEGYDISHIQGAYTVASMVVFQGGIPAKKEYRHFRIRETEGIDDFRSMQEVLRRRFERWQKEKEARLAGEKGKESFSVLPDLLLIDGGKGQLHAVVEILQNMDLPPIPVISLAKRMEEVFVPGQSEPICLPLGNPGLSLLQQVRDEAHRFAITYNRQLRRKGQVQSILDEIPGIGESRKEKLLQVFGNMEAIRQARPYELAAVPGMNQKVAQTVYQYFHQERQRKKKEEKNEQETN